jgi:hypothetical protein
MRRPILTVAPALLAAGWLASFFAPLLSPGRVLANRDIPFFHLPLRASLRQLVESGLPTWSPWLHGGQPVLSNPSYAAFYPPNWLIFLVPPAYALNLLVVFHGAVAFAGAWYLTRRLGAGRGAAALAAVGYTGSGAILSLLSALTLYLSMAWFPWVLAFGDAALRSEPGPEEGRRRLWLRPALLAGGALALQLLNGEPVTVVVSGLGLLCLAAARLRRPLVAARVVVPVLAAVALAAVQLVPTLGRVADSPRAGGLGTTAATVWSAPPERLAEVVFPHFFGDPNRDQEGLFFGWNLHDRDYPYVTSVYPGLLLVVLGVSALALWPVPRRAAWALAVIGGCFLALGRHNPLFEALREAVPVLAVLRFPEKFAILALPALGFAGALGWQRLQEERAAGRPQAVDLPLALSLVLLATAGGITVVLYTVPRAAVWFIRAHGAPNPSPEKISLGLEYLRGEGWAAVATAAAVALLLALCRWRRPSARALSAAAVALLAADLWHYGHGLVRTLPAETYQRPPSYLHEVLPPGTRLFVESVPLGETGFAPHLDSGDIESAPLRALLLRSEPYAGVLWGVPYALHEDYDLMLTEWGRMALLILHSEWPQPELASRFLGTWNVGALLLRKPVPVWAAELLRDPHALPVLPVTSPYTLPRYRFAPRASFHDSYGSALYVARSERYRSELHEHCFRAGEPPGTVDFPGHPRLLSVRDEGGRIEIRYSSDAPAFFTAAITFDEGWRGTLDDAVPVSLYPTAVCQMSMVLPAGEHTLRLRYSDPRVTLGASITLAAAALCGAILWRLSRRRAPDPPRNAVESA